MTCTENGGEVCPASGLDITCKHGLTRSSPCCKQTVCTTCTEPTTRVSPQGSSAKGSRGRATDLDAVGGAGWHAHAEQHVRVLAAAKPAAVRGGSRCLPAGHLVGTWAARARVAQHHLQAQPFLWLGVTGRGRLQTTEKGPLHTLDHPPVLELCHLEGLVVQRGLHKVQEGARGLGDGDRQHGLTHARVGQLCLGGGMCKAWLFRQIGWELNGQDSAHRSEEQPQPR